MQNPSPKWLNIPCTGERIFPHQQSASPVQIRKRLGLAPPFFKFLQLVEKNRPVRISQLTVICFLRYRMPGMEERNPLLKKQVAEQSVGSLPCPVFHHRVEVVFLPGSTSTLELRTIATPRKIPQAIVNIRRGARGNLFHPAAISSQRGMLEALATILRCGT